MEKKDANLFGVAYVTMLAYTLDFCLAFECCTDAASNTCVVIDIR